jgi:16S rRNA (guanine527-N7)-methyltransferase
MAASSENANNDRLSTGEVAAALAPYRVVLSDQQLSAIACYVQLLIDWNESINLTAIENPAEIVAKHFGESIFAASAVHCISGRLADVGTGAGFPGLALKIAIPDLNVLLIEPNNKKCAFLTEVKRSLGLTGVEIFRGRYAEASHSVHGFDFVCSRALGNYRELLRWSRTSMNAHGRVILWLGTDDSVSIVKTAGWSWDVPIPIPHTQRRVIQVGTPTP